ncbi:MAG: lipid-A-disaccharide synthase [Myxococcota bacterium]|jgi:lipid-A-disaccharide synthase
MDVLVVAGEASGDQHAAGVVAALRRQRPELRFFGMGGPKLAAQGLEVVHGAHELSVMGLVEVLPKVPRIWRVMGDLERAAKERRPACALLVDVPDFNLRLAKRLKALDIPVVGYVAPTVWAWREGRTKTIARRYDRLLCILPFEEQFLRERGVNATYIGNPVLDQVPAVAEPAVFRRSLDLAADRPILAVLPGSRRGEIARILPTLVEVCRRVRALRPGVQFVIPVAPGLPRELLTGPFEGTGLSPVFIDGRAPEVVGASDVAVVASGTATLEAGLMRRPMVVVYRVNPLSYAVGKVLVKIPFFSLVNLLAGKRVVPELLQGEFTAERVVQQLEPLWDGPAREACLAGLDEVRAVLGPKGASERAADAVIAHLTRA